MVNYKDLGLVNTRDMFAKAIKGGYASSHFLAFWQVVHLGYSINKEGIPAR